MVEQLYEGLYRIDVALPQNPLRQLNSYVLCGRGRNLLIDTGFNRSECLDALEQGIRELHLDMDRTDIFLTHLHSDHSGLAHRIVSPHGRIYMSPTDRDEMNAAIRDPACWEEMARFFRAQGFPAQELEQALVHNPGRLYQPDAPLDAVPAAEGCVLEIGGIALEPIFTPGHTPGHLCLYWREPGILFSGDHILFNITPNISVWSCMSDPLGEYFTSLGKIARLPAQLCLPGHRLFGTDLHSRVDALLRHHHDRLSEVLTIVSAHPGITGYDTARQMTWSIRSKGWEDFPVGQKWFAVGEAMTHLAFLSGLGALVQEHSGGCTHYSVQARPDLAQAIAARFQAAAPLQ